MSNLEKLVKSLEKGNGLTHKDILKMGINNPTDAIWRLRKRGYCIYANSKKGSATVYRIGAPTKAMIASLYEAYGASMYDKEFLEL